MRLPGSGIALQVICIASGYKLSNCIAYWSLRIYTDFETNFGIARSYEKNPEISYTTKINKHTASGFLFL